MRTPPTPALLVFPLLLAVVGTWLVIAPVAIGYQDAPAAWVAATWNDTLVGALLVLGGLGLLAAQVTSLARRAVRTTTGAAARDLP